METDEARKVCRGQIWKGLVVLGPGELALCPEALKPFVLFCFKQSGDIDFNLRGKNFD